MSNTESADTSESEMPKASVDTPFDDTNLRRIAFFRKHHANIIRTVGVIGCRVDMKPGSIEPIVVAIREDCDLFAVQQSIHDTFQALGLVFQADYIFEKKKRGDFVKFAIVNES